MINTFFTLPASRHCVCAAAAFTNCPTDRTEGLLREAAEPCCFLGMKQHALDQVMCQLLKAYIARAQ